MTRTRTLFVAGIAAVAVAIAGGARVAQAVSGDGEQVTGPNAKRAAEAALQEAGGGSVLEVERQDGDGAGVYEVEVRRPDGATVEVHLDAGFRPVGTELDDDGAGEDEERDSDD